MRCGDAFSLVEVLIVVAVIGVMSTLVLSYIQGTSGHALQVVARQQQAQVQSALDSWVAATSSSPGGLASARDRYNSQANKILLLSNHIQRDSFARFSTNEGNIVRSAALTRSKARLEFSPTWTTTQAPSVNWVNTSQ